MKKYIISLSMLILTNSLSATTQSAIFETLLSKADGVFINANTIEWIQYFMHEVICMLTGDKQKNSNHRIGRYIYENEHHSIRSLRKKEEFFKEHNEINPELALCLQKVKSDFIELSSKFLTIARSAKPAISTLIEDFCKNKPHSPLLLWCSCQDGQEIPMFEKHINSFVMLDAFCTDTINFFHTFLQYCPKAQKQLKQRLEKWTKIKDMLLQVIENHATSAQLYTFMKNEKIQDEFLKHIKQDHIDKLSLHEITPNIIQNLYIHYIQSHT